MKRKCPSCKDISVSVLPLMLWAARCKSCGAKLAINQFFSFLFYLFVTPAFVVGAFMWIEHLSYVAGIFLVFAYCGCIIGFEVFGPIVVRERGNR